MGSGGGGSSGAVSHSAYLEDVHSDWLNASGTDTIEKSITEVMDSALGSSPFAAMTAYDPDTYITAFQNVVAAYAAALAGLPSAETTWATLHAQAVLTIGAIPTLAIADIADTADVPGITPAQIAADVAAFANDLDNDILTRVLPRFRRGMQDINAVVSSAFPIGEAILWAFRDNDLAKHDSAIRLDAAGKNAELGINNQRLHLDVRKANLAKDIDVGHFNLTINTDYRKMYLGAVEEMAKIFLQELSFDEGYARLAIESYRIAAVLKKEEAEDQKEIDEADAKWDLEVFTYGCNVMAAISGGVSGSKVKTSKLQSAVGGGLTGAAAGGMIGSAAYGATYGSSAGIYGAAIGAVLGAAYGLLSS